MKKVIISIIAIAISVSICGQNYTIQKNGVDDLVSEYAEELIRDNTPKDARQYAFTLTQNGSSFVIEYSVTPDNIQGKEQTDNVWDALELTVKKAFDSIKRQSASSASVTTSQQVAQAKETATPQKQPQPQPQPQAQPVAKPVSQTPFATTQPSSAYGNAAVSQPVPNSTVGTASWYTMEDVQAGRVAVGDCLMFPDGSRGVVFYITNDGHGLAVSIDEAELKWENVSNSRQCHDIATLPNEDRVSKYFSYQLGWQNTNAIIQQLGAMQAPAANW